MVSDDDIKDIKYDVREIRRDLPPKERPGLYLMVVLAMLASLQSCSYLESISSKLERMETKQNNINKTLEEVGKDYNGKIMVDEKTLNDYINRASKQE
jgi:uncharacterized protein (UPF0335 family)